VAVFKSNFLPGGNRHGDGVSAIGAEDGLIYARILPTSLPRLVGLSRHNHLENEIEAEACARLGMAEEMKMRSV
jgi:hypothetical protein